jgi:hypothetical protein
MSCDDASSDLFDELMTTNRAGGNVVHHNDTVGSLPDFICQFQDLVDVNLGDGGTMFVTAKAAFWQGG